MSIQEAVATKIVEAGGKLKVQSALNPILWLCGIITIPSLICYSLMENPPVWLIILAFAPVIVALFGFVFLLFVDRDKLQSESYQIRKLEIEMIEEKGLKAVESITVEAITEPETILLEEGDSESE